MDFTSFIPDITTTIIGSVLLALLFFGVKKWCFPIADIKGQWYYEVKTDETAYKPYENMILRYVAMLKQEENQITGSVEKTFEDSSTGKREFVGKNRTRGDIEGHIEKKYLSGDRVFLHVIEKGHGREYTTCFDLAVGPNGKMIGTFRSTAADQEGTVSWQRTPF